MPMICSVFGCYNSSRKKSISFHAIPSIKYNEGCTILDLTKKRRRQWLKAINRADITMESIKYHHKVCGDHFISGKPAYYRMETDPDWVPNKNLSSTSTSKSRFEIKKSHLLQNNTCGMDLLSETVTLSDPEEPEDVTDSIKLIATDKVEKGTQTDLTMETITNLERTSLALNDMTVEISSFQQKLSFNSFTKEEFRNNKDSVKFYTGLPTFALLMNVVNLVSPTLHHTKNSLSKFQEILLVLIKIRLGLANKLLGHIFSIDSSTVSRIFLRVLNVMYYQMKFLIVWPKKDALQRTMPLEFVRCFSKRLAVIIDCFEVFIEQPSNIKARVETYSHYKSNNTIKYLTGITPQGSVCFISNGYGGRTSDKFIVENSDFFISS